MSGFLTKYELPFHSFNRHVQNTIEKKIPCSLFALGAKISSLSFFLQTTVFNEWKSCTLIVEVKDPTVLENLDI